MTPERDLENRQASEKMQRKLRFRGIFLVLAGLGAWMIVILLASHLL